MAVSVSASSHTRATRPACLGQQILCRRLISRAGRVVVEEEEEEEEEGGGGGGGGRRRRRRN